MHTSPTSRCHRVVIAEDGRDSADTMGMLLTMMGHEVRITYDGQEALTVAEAFRPDVMILDVGMPKLDGYEAARWVRNQAWGKRVLLVAMTGWAREEDRRRSAESGFDRHLVKPANLTEVEALLASFEGARDRTGP